MRSLGECGAPILPPGVLKELKLYDKSLDLLWNRDRGRWVVVQDRRLDPTAKFVWVPLLECPDELRGCPAAQDPSPYEALLILDFDGSMASMSAEFIVRLVDSMTERGGDVEKREARKARNKMRELRKERVQQDWSDNMRDELKFMYRAYSKNSILVPDLNFQF